VTVSAKAGPAMTQDIVVQDREELILLLCEAAEFEHSVMGAYLFAQWSLKRRGEPGVCGDGSAAIERWRAGLRQVALEEMLHLTLVNNILAAIGASPHLWCPAFPIKPGHFPADVVMPLRGFDEAALAHFMFIERPEGSTLPDAAAFHHPDRYRRVARGDLLSPMPQDYESQGHLYHGVINGLAALCARHGEAKIFVGHGDAQVTSAEFGLPGLFKVTDLASARRAIEEIVSQGEGAPGHSETSHYARFSAMAREYAAMKARDPNFAPAWPVALNPALTVQSGPDSTFIADPLAAKVVDLGNAIYGLTMRIFAQIFAPSPLPPQVRAGLGLAATELMLALRMVGEAAARLPIDSARTGMTAGLNFALPISAGLLVQSCAAQILSERNEELAGAAVKLEARGVFIGVSPKLKALTARLNALATAPHPVIIVAPNPAPIPAPISQTRAKIATRYDPKLCIHARHCVLDAPNLFGGRTQSPRLDPNVMSVDYCVRVAENCPSGAITYERGDGGPQESPPTVNIVRVRENGPYAIRAEMHLEGRGRMLRATMCRCGRSKNKPFCDNSHIEAAFAATGEPETTPADALENRAGPLSVTPITDGPLQLNGNVEIICGTGRTLFRTQTARLCRCGGSATKPFCDGSHVTNGFRSN
jgi:CDGSH-type Zn-finger protein/uncharacterized Fe-S cluster protein YjdI